MKLSSCCLTALVAGALPLGSSLLAAENFLSNPTTLYPPGCATSQVVEDLLPAKESEITSGLVRLHQAADADQLHDVEISVWRKGCSEPGRSLLMFEMRVPDDDDGVSEAVLCPEFIANRFGIAHPLRGVEEPNSWQSSTHARLVYEGQSTTLFLDGISVYDAGFDSAEILTPAEYNEDFELQVLDPRGVGGFTIAIPEYHDQHKTDEMPLNGRLSGTWVVPGVSDQGFVLAFEDLVEPVSPHLFFSWYTFNSSGQPMWLTGNTTFEAGENSASFDLIHVTGGTFLASQTAERTVVGSATLGARGCNELVLHYDLDQLGFGQGGVVLNRLFSLETQGYACRDNQARIEALGN